MRALVLASFALLLVLAAGERYSHIVPAQPVGRVGAQPARLRRCRCLHFCHAP